MADRVVTIHKDGRLAPLEPGDRLVDSAGNILAGGPKATTRTLLATTGNIANLATGAPDVVDTVTVQIGDRILVKDQSTLTQNGVYVVDVVGTGVNGQWSRASDFNENQEISALILVQVTSGDVNNDTLWSLESTGGLTIGVSNIVFIKESRDRDRISYSSEVYLDGLNQLTSALVMEVTIDRPGFLVAASIKTRAARTAGTIAVEPHINGTGLTPTGLDLLIDGTNTTKDYGTVTYDTSGYAVVAGDVIGFLVTTSGFTPLNNTLTLQITMEFDF